MTIRGVFLLDSAGVVAVIKQNEMLKRLAWSGLLAGLGAAASFATLRLAHVIWVRAFGEDPPE